MSLYVSTRTYKNEREIFGFWPLCGDDGVAVQFTCTHLVYILFKKFDEYDKRMDALER